MEKNAEMLSAKRFGMGLWPTIIKVGLHLCGWGSNRRNAYFQKEVSRFGGEGAVTYEISGRRREGFTAASNYKSLVARGTDHSSRRPSV